MPLDVLFLRTYINTHTDRTTKATVGAQRTARYYIVRNTTWEFISHPAVQDDLGVYWIVSLPFTHPTYIFLCCSNSRRRSTLQTSVHANTCLRDIKCKSNKARRCACSRASNTDLRLRIRSGVYRCFIRGNQVPGPTYVLFGETRDAENEETGD